MEIDLLKEWWKEEDEEDESMDTEDPSLNNNTSDSIAIAVAIQAVQALPSIEEELVLDAFDFLAKGNAEIFLAMIPKLQRKWLISDEI